MYYVNSTAGGVAGPGLADRCSQVAVAAVASSCVNAALHVCSVWLPQRCWQTSQPSGDAPAAGARGDAAKTCCVIQAIGSVLAVEYVARPICMSTNGAASLLLLIYVLS
jgi:hypothetical protein